VQGESFGIVLLEAMAAGLPVVASEIVGYRDVVTDGQEGILVPPRNASAVAEAVCRILEDRTMAASMGAAGIEKAALYSWRRIAEQILDLYVRTGNRPLPSTHPAVAWEPLA
jgi:phosphatidylinositol alpha-mannosyltransferase